MLADTCSVDGVGVGVDQKVKCILCVKSESIKTVELAPK